VIPGVVPPRPRSVAWSPATGKRFSGQFWLGSLLLLTDQARREGAAFPALGGVVQGYESDLMGPAE